MQLNIFKQKESKRRCQVILLFKGPLNFYFSRWHIETFGYPNETASVIPSCLLCMCSTKPSSSFLDQSSAKNFCSILFIHLHTNRPYVQLRTMHHLLLVPVIFKTTLESYTMKRYEVWKCMKGLFLIAHVHHTLSWIDTQ